MNDENLIPLNKRPKSVQREIQRMGTEAAAKARKEKRTLREMSQLVLGELVTLKNGDEVTVCYAMVKKHAQKAVSGDAKSAKLIADWSGEAPTRNEFTGEDGAPLRITIENIDKMYDELRSDKD